MIDKIIEDLRKKLNIKITKKELIFYSEGTTNSIVFNINNKYIVKTVDEITMKTQLEFLTYYKEVESFQKIICYNQELKYICFSYLEGINFVKSNDINVNSIVKQLYNIVNSYREYNSNKYGYLFEETNTWKEFLLSEINYSKEMLKDIKMSTDKLDRIINSFDKYKVKGYLIHGDFGTHNFLINKDKIQVIDPMPVIGDNLYDFYFSILSNSKIFENIKLNQILELFERDNTYKKELFYIVLFIRLARAYKYDKLNFEKYINLYNNFEV